LLLFDIDGTLLTTDHAGLDALTTALTEVLGARRGLEGVQMAGNTDLAAIAQVCSRDGLPYPDADTLAEVRRVYVTELDRRLVPGQGRLMPGVRELLAALASHNQVMLALATGNIREGAYRKLAHYGIDHYFGFGGFGCDAAVRSELVGHALRRAAEREPQLGADNTVLIGDTAHDIRSCQPWGVRSVGVATGPLTVAELRAAGADHVLPDFTDLAATLAVLLR